MIDLRERLERLRALKDATPKSIPVEALQRLNRIIETMENLLENSRMIEGEAQILAHDLREFAEIIAPTKRIPKVPRSPNPPELAVNNKVTHGFGMALAAGGPNTRKKVNGWRDNVINGHPVYPCTQGRDEMTVYLEPGDYNALELWAKVHSLDALTVDVFLAVLALVCDPRNKAAYPHFGWFTVNPTQVADMKAFRRYGNDRRVLIGKIVEALHTLSDLRTDFLIHWPGQGKNEQNRIARETSCRLFHIGSVLYLEQGELFKHPEEFPKEEKNIVGVSIFIGKWGTYWLRDGETYYWVAAASRRLLELEHRSDRMGDGFAKKMGMLLLTVEGGTRSHNKTLEFTIRDLLEKIGELLAEEFRGKRRRDNGEVEESREGEHWASRTEEYLQDGLTTLRQNGLLAGYNFSSDYPELGDKRSASRSAYRVGAELRSSRVAGVALRAPPINSLER